jgi:DNA-binding GntR family transcriptional regulator
MEPSLMNLFSAPPPPARHKTAKDYVCDSLTQAFSNGQLPPGSRLNEKDLSEWLNVSRTPIREALAALAKDGLIEVIPHRGAVVKAVTAEDIREEYTIRAALEGLAIELAVPHVPEEVLAELAALVDEMHDLLRAGDVPGFLECNRQMHLRLYSYCGSPRLLAMIESAWDKENFFRRFYTLHEGPDEEEHMHRDLLDACRRRDSQGAHHLVKESLLTAAALLASRLVAAGPDRARGTR